MNARWGYYFATGIRDTRNPRRIMRAHKYKFRFGCLETFSISFKWKAFLENMEIIGNWNFTRVRHLEERIVFVGPWRCNLRRSDFECQSCVVDLGLLIVSKTCHNENPFSNRPFSPS